ncbi:hypothetical protein E2C01_025514 [Portunus trituberculatus]|uniref:Uncharacterized protein n=1 Tax=Portunus trituberculatus TaxID=210409 RepID=A0A5B7EFG4_PORTR|nr:hypothetical protein [Portunus trituberculatus]
MKERFASRDTNILTSLADTVVGKATEESFKAVSDFYSIDTDVLMGETAIFHNLESVNLKTANQPRKAQDEEGPQRNVLSSQEELVGEERRVEVEVDLPWVSGRQVTTKITPHSEHKEYAMNTPPTPTTITLKGKVNPTMLWKILKQTLMIPVPMFLTCEGRSSSTIVHEMGPMPIP